jgi:hypothetical protein
MTLLKLILLAVVSVITGFYITQVVDLRYPDERIYDTYTYYQMYEDGSVDAELLNGTEVSFCIKNALCDKD